jgi:hypothetical protein
LTPFLTLFPHHKEFSMSHQLHEPPARRWLAGTGLLGLGLSLALLQACGGGGGGNSSVTPTINGTVNGFGSVIVDSVEIEDAYARVAHENADGSLSNDVLQMGQRVRLSHDGRGRASQVLIDAAVIGLASSINTSTNTLSVAGQRVLVNVDPTSSNPLTVFGGGYTSLSDVLANDLVQVHGTPVYDANTNRYQVQATRIQKDSGATRVQLNGLISGYTSSANGASFSLNGLTINTSASTALRPSGSVLADGVQITAYGNALVGNTLSATHIRVNRNQNSGDTTMQAQLSGAVSRYNSSAGTFDLQGTTVRVGSATLQPTGAVLADNAYVMVKGSVGSDGSVSATSINVRTSDTSTALAQVQLIGPISDYVDNSSFIVRGVPVDASTATLSNCSALANDTTVRVQATQQAGTAVVLATRVSCQPTAQTQVIRPLEGTIASVDTTGKTFSLTRENSSSQTVQWDDTTTFLGLTADSSLASKTVHVEGFLSGTTLMARVVRLDDDSAQAPQTDDAHFRRPRSGNSSATPQGWTQYRANRH